MDVVLADDDGFDARLTVSGGVLGRSRIGWGLWIQHAIRCLGMEELVGKHLRRLRTLLWIVAKHPFHQSDSFGRGSRNDSLKIDLRMFWHGEKLAVRQPPGIRPIIGVRFAKDH